MSNVKSKQTNETSMSKILIIFFLVNLEFFFTPLQVNANGIFFGRLLNDFNENIYNHGKQTFFSVVLYEDGVDNKRKLRVLYIDGKLK